MMLRWKHVMCKLRILLQKGKDLLRSQVLLFFNLEFSRWDIWNQEDVRKIIFKVCFPAKVLIRQHLHISNLCHCFNTKVLIEV